MGIRIKEWKVVYDSVTMKPIEPRYAFPDKERVKEYLAENPFPEDREDDGWYSEEDLLYDTQTTGMWTLPDCITKEQERHITEMVRYFL